MFLGGSRDKLVWLHYGETYVIRSTIQADTHELMWWSKRHWRTGREIFQIGDDVACWKSHLNVASFWRSERKKDAWSAENGQNCSERKKEENLKETKAENAEIVSRIFTLFTLKKIKHKASRTCHRKLKIDLIRIQVKGLLVWICWHRKTPLRNFLSQTLAGT